ncbi:MetQ/NlpA family ABC transporter substrate-binding protein [Gracilibacillus sp. S3-1-1]|uniref:MetQ/NlpA family ABC transporter substrate-binding protein n=1 Tax=Gracilibacillus pellucidus TaxID=3095368 RepID=A0ACC6M7F8_9BACI|nr:MetQ/NlpA family ABC transporter substrate-binding protein [Gracilibacillus sp. S3-1-1]MDX8046874.1 MetQ/NlpA family ABC transporter substrate-binding protein [Gracilibacillus sp. S3-1-1]
MKKLLAVLFTTLLLFVLAACGTSEEEESSNNEGETSGDLTEIVVGASAVPHTEILEKAVPLLKEEGIDLQIETYQDFVLPNQDLDSGLIDANYYQHIPFLENERNEKGYDFANLGGIHIEPIGIYSKGIESIDDIEEGTVFIMSRNTPEHGRILSLLQEADLITLDENVNPDDATVDDVVDNPLDLEFETRIEPAFLTQNYEREEDALVAINTNYAIEFGLVPTEDALILEESDSPYANLIVARSEDEDNEALHKLVEVLRSEEIQTFMEEEYNGAIIPVNE